MEKKQRLDKQQRDRASEVVVRIKEHLKSLNKHISFFINNMSNAEGAIDDHSQGSSPTKRARSNSPYALTRS